MPISWRSSSRRELVGVHTLQSRVLSVACKSQHVHDNLVMHPKCHSPIDYNANHEHFADRLKYAHLGRKCPSTASSPSKSCVIRSAAGVGFPSAV